MRCPSLASLPLIVLAIALAASACSGAPDAGGGGGKPSIVVTYSILGSVVRELVGDDADVTVIMPNGIDPHEYQPSAKDVEALNDAALVVRNGLGLEEGIKDALAEAQDSGVATFTASDHIDVRTVGEGEAAEPEDPDQQPGAEDPHLWMDPLNMREIVAALAPVLAEQLGLVVSGRAADLERRLEQLNAEDERILAAVPAENRKLVTGHESMGYFARRYGFVLIGAIIPSLTSQAGVSASELADLKDTIEQEHVRAIFTELGTPPEVARTIGEEAGVQVIEIATHNLPADDSYFSFMTDVSRKVADGLDGS